MRGVTTDPGAITHVSDTALLVAGCRAVECEKPLALVRDPFAARLAGERGEAMFRKLTYPEIMTFGIALRTRFIDDLLLETIAEGRVSTVLNLGAGLDTRPWRLDLPPDLRWIEVDFDPILKYKEALLAGEKPRCCRERLSADATDPIQRQAIYSAASAAPALILTEGFLMYLSASTVAAIASEVAPQKQFASWITEITTTGFSNALGGAGRTVRHIQPDDHLTGEQVLDTLFAHRWASAKRRSYITDLALAKERIAAMIAGLPTPPKPPNFPPNDPSGVHLLRRE